jgi:hypothetical protein
VKEFKRRTERKTMRNGVKTQWFEKRAVEGIKGVHRKMVSDAR